MYRQKFRGAEQALESRGRPLQKPIADVLDGAAPRIYAVLEKFGVFEGMEEELTDEMVRLADGFDREEAKKKKYLDEMEAKIKGMQSSLDALPRFDNHHEHYVEMKESNRVHVLGAGVRGTSCVD
ncbi:hypothetical protein F5Y11DRAFT_346571 [Daldinia sp. FL1419]|nr:hypothetical protein F5Y11DRAFT_346571 [Daldinia sp. FL1419]